MRFYRTAYLVISSEPFSSDERRAVLTLSSLYSMRMLGLFMVLPLITVYAQDMPGATPLTLGLALGAHGLTQACLQIPLGWLSDRIGRMPVILAGLALFALGSFVAGYADSIYGIIVGRLLQGAGAIAAALMALAADYTRESQRTKAMAIIGASIGASFVLALVAGPLLASVGGLSLVFYMTAALAILGFILMLTALPTVPAQRDMSRQVEAQHFRRALSAPGLPLLYGSVFVLHLLLMAAFVAIPGQLAGAAGLPPDHHWALYLATVLLSLPGVVWLLKRKRSAASPRSALVIAVLCLVGGELWVLNTQDIYIMSAGLVVFFVGVNVLEATLPSLVSLAAPVEIRGTALGVFSSSQFLGAFIGGAAGGLFFAWAGVIGLTVLICGLACMWLVGLSVWQPSELALNDS
jgi:MFS family permease